MKQIKRFFIVILMFLSSFSGLNGQACKILSTLTDDLPSPALESFFKDTPDGIKFYSILAKNGEAVLAALRANPNSLNILKHISTRFSFNGIEGIEGLSKLFEQFPAEKYEELLTIIKLLDDEYDNGDILNIKIHINKRGELEADFRDTRDIGDFIDEKKQQTKTQSNGLNEQEFDAKLSDLTKEYVDVSKPSTTLTLGKDNTVTCGKNYPTPPGVMDVHVHGTYSNGSYLFVEKTQNNKIHIRYSAAQMASKIMSHPAYGSTNLLRIFSCQGAYAGAELALLTNRPVITGSTDAIAVDVSNGNMSLPSGTLFLFKNN